MAYQTKHIDPSAPELSAQCNVHKTGDLNVCPLICTFLADDFRWRLAISASHCESTEVFLWQKGL